MRWQVLCLRLRLPNLCEAIDDPVVLTKEECVDWCEAGLYDSSAVPTSEVVRSWVATRFLWATKPTLTSARQGFTFLAVFLSFQPGCWYSRSFASYCDTVSEANGCLLVRAIDVAAIDECCYPIYLLSRISVYRTEYVRPENRPLIWFLDFSLILITWWMDSMLLVLWNFGRCQRQCWNISEWKKVLSYLFARLSFRNTPALRNMCQNYFNLKIPKVWGFIKVKYLLLERVWCRGRGIVQTAWPCGWNPWNPLFFLLLWTCAFRLILSLRSHQPAQDFKNSIFNTRRTMR